MAALGEKRPVQDALAGIQTPILAAVWNANQKLTVHVGQHRDRSRIKAEILSVLGKVGVTRVRVSFHTMRELLAPRSLERLVQRFMGGEIALDPTGSITRAAALVSATRAARASLGAVVNGVFFAPRLRALYVSLDSKRISTTDKVKVGELADIERHILSALREAFAGNVGDCPAVRVGFGLPQAELVPVDQRSVVSWTTRAVQAVRRYWKPLAVATVFGLGANAATAKDPAVSQTNLKVTGAAVDVDGDTGAFFSGGLTAPLGESWGIQVEAGVADTDGTSVSGFAGHIFTRDPDSYLLGVFAAYASEDDFDLDATRLGAEAEIYLTQVTLLAKVGYQFSDVTNVDGAFADIELRWYVSENFAFSAGGAFDEAGTIGRLGAEWRPGFAALPGLAFRVDGAMGDNDYDSLLGGITYYFGADASLKDRHRRQDPDSALFALFQSVEQERANLCALATYGCN